MSYKNMDNAYCKFVIDKKNRKIFVTMVWQMIYKLGWVGIFTLSKNLRIDL